MCKHGYEWCPYEHEGAYIVMCRPCIADLKQSEKNWHSLADDDAMALGKLRAVIVQLETLVGKQQAEIERLRIGIKDAIELYVWQYEWYKRLSELIKPEDDDETNNI